MHHDRFHRGKSNGYSSMQVFMMKNIENPATSCLRQRKRQVVNCQLNGDRELAPLHGQPLGRYRRAVLSESSDDQARVVGVQPREARHVRSPQFVEVGFDRYEHLFVARRESKISHT